MSGSYLLRWDKMKNTTNQKGQAPNLCKHSSGQALLIVVLVMAVALTIGLAVVSRSITDIKISRQEEESSRVFSVAEAGIEEALKLGSGTSGTIGEGEALIGYTVSETGQGGGTEFVFPAINAGDTQTVWLVEHDDGNLTETGKYAGTTIDLYWGNESQAADQATTPALEATVIYKDGSNYKIKRGAYDPYDGVDSSRNANGFDDADSAGGYSVGVKTFQFRKTGFTLPALPLIPYALRLKLIYNNDQAQILGIAGTSNFPSQGKCYESTASLSTSGITRKVQQCQFHKTPPGIFDYVLFSEGGLTK
ncbi:MAG: Uncharacterized protein LiPW31_79 [Microgenomates group bacterium LiPW_31]|nr:MAG: Uncharacterized protein LiPW31_79 [Microgenomates group bacterium LiPW_31]